MSEEEKSAASSAAAPPESGQSRLDALLLKQIEASIQQNQNEAVFGTWVNTATKGLFYPPDRRRVRQELRDHFEDRLEDARAKGCPDEEAYRLAVRSLGDPEETGELLRAVHKPWLSWLLRAARIVLVLVLAAVLIGFGREQLSIRSLQFITSMDQILDRPVTDNETCTLVARRRAVCTDEARFGPFRVRCAGVNFYRTVELEQWYERERLASNTGCEIVLSFTAMPWHTLESDVAARVIHVADDQGTRYYNRSMINMGPKDLTYVMNCLRTGLDETAVCLIFDEVPLEAEWLDITLEQGELHERLRINLGRWEIQKGQLPYLESEEEAVERLMGLGSELLFHTDKPEHEITRSGRAVSGETEHVAVPWSGLCRFFVDGEAAASLELTDLNLNPVSTPEELTADAEIELMECVLAFRDYPAEMTSFQTEMMERIRVGVPGTEQEAKAYVVQSPLWFSNESLWRLEWRPVPGADRYELSYTDETGETISVILELGEEAAP